METIWAAGGSVVSLAYPHQIVFEDALPEELVRILTGYSLDAIECFHLRYTPEQETFYLCPAEKYGLHVVSGSDSYS